MLRTYPKVIIRLKLGGLKGLNFQRADKTNIFDVINSTHRAKI